MRVQRKVKIANIKAKPKLNPEVFRLAFHIKMGDITIDEIPPIKIEYVDDGLYLLKKGNLTYSAFKLLGIKDIKSKFYEAD